MDDPFSSQMSIKPDQILDIIVRRKWLIVIPLCISLTIGLYQTLTVAKTYEAMTMILVQPQRVPTNYVRSVVTSSINQRISTISQQILSRSNLEKIIDQFGLYENSEGIYLEDKIASMRNRVKVRTERSRGGSAAFSIIFTGSEPQRVMRIANTLASYFMDENLKVREAQAVGTSEFLESELEKTRKNLENREKRLSVYKQQYFGGLPSELNTNLTTLNRLQGQLSNKQLLLREIKNSQMVLETQIAQSKEMNSQQGMNDPFSDFDFEEEATFEKSNEPENQRKLTSIQKQYDNLLLRYTKRHPDVAKLKKVIEKLKKAVEEEKMAQQKTMEADAELQQEDITDENDIGSVMPDFAAMQQEVQLKQIKNEILKIQSDIRKIKQQMKIYQKRIDDTPKRELELQSLQRDYSNIQGTFNSLLKRKLEAELSVNMEKKQKGEQFRILDHARLPEKPISPNVKMLFMLSIASGLGAGAGIIFLLEVLDSSIRTEDQIEKDLGLVILASIPPLKKSIEKSKQKIEWVLFVCLSLYATLFFAFFATLNYKGLDRTLNFIKMNLNI